MDQNQLITELRAAPLPKPLKKIAVHLYLNFYFEKEIERWELWETKNAFEKIKTNQSVSSKKSNGHIYKNLKAPFDGVGGGNSFGIKKWTGEEAQKIYHSMNVLFNTYPHKDFYRAWPGPNSNTFIATVLKTSGIDISLPATAIGKDFIGITPKFKIKKNICHINVLTAGVKLNTKAYWELHFAGLTIGYEKEQQEWKLPFGKGLFPYSFREEIQNK